MCTMCYICHNPLTLRNFQNGSTGLCLVVMYVYCAHFFYPFFAWGGHKNVFFAPKSSFPAISGSSRLKWVEHRSNWVEQYISHPGWSVEKMLNEAAVTTYGQIWQFLAEIGHFWGLLGPPRAISMGAKRS